MAAARRAIQRNRDKFPLLAGQMPEQSPEERVHEYQRAEVIAEGAGRLHRAQQWRQVRRELRALPRRKRLAVLYLWNNIGYPATPAYLGCLVTQAQRELNGEVWPENTPPLWKKALELSQLRRKGAEWRRRIGWDA